MEGAPAFQSPSLINTLCRRLHSHREQSRVFLQHLDAVTAVKCAKERSQYIFFMYVRAFWVFNATDSHEIPAKTQHRCPEVEGALTLSQASLANRTAFTSLLQRFRRSFESYIASYNSRNVIF